MSKTKEYEVDYILDKRTRKGSVEYLIKWKGFSKKYNSWIAKNNCNCKEKIRYYEKKMKNKQKTKRCKSRISKKAENSRKRKPIKNEENEEEEEEEEEEEVDDQEDEEYFESDHETESEEKESDEDEDEDDFYTCSASSSSSNNFEPQTTTTRNKNLFKFNEKNIKDEEPRKIIGASLQNRSIWFLIELKNENTDLQMVPASYAKQHWPDLVFKYYESNLYWK